MKEQYCGKRAAGRYALEKGVQVETWKQERPCLFLPDTVTPVWLDEEELALLKHCDGITPIEPSPVRDRLEVMRIIRKCDENEHGVQPVPVIEYPNRYVETIDWTITDRCNYNCRHCFHAVDNTTHRDEFSLAEALHLLDEIRSCGIRSISLTGGEPTLYPWFREVVEGMRERGLCLNTLITNGSLLTPELLSFLKALHPNVLIRLSFDGIGWHDWMRQHRGSEEKALEAIRMSKAAGLQVHINTNVHRKNADVMFDSVKMLAGLGVDRIRVIRTSESPRWELNKADDTLTPEEYYDFSVRLAEQLRCSGIQIPVVIWQSLFLFGRKKTFRILPIKGNAECFKESARLCSALTRKPSVQANGDVVPCAPLGGLLAFHGVHLGNVHEKGLRELLTEGPFIDIITSTVGDKLQQNQKCASCRYVKECQGGCPALSLVSGGSVYSSDNYKCVFFRNGYAEKYRKALEGWTDLGALTTPRKS